MHCVFTSLIPHFLGLLITGWLNECASFPNAGGTFFVVRWISMLFSISPVPVQGCSIWDPSSIRVLQLWLAGAQDLCSRQVSSLRVRRLFAPLLDHDSFNLCSMGMMEGSCQQLPPWIPSGNGKGGPDLRLSSPSLHKSSDDRKGGWDHILVKNIRKCIS